MNSKTVQLASFELITYNDLTTPFHFLPGLINRILLPGQTHYLPASPLWKRGIEGEWHLLKLFWMTILPRNHQSDEIVG
jgi:hypothetical protein